MYFNRKNAEQKNWRMIKKGKHFLFGCSLVFAIGAALATPTVQADTAEAKVDATVGTAQAEPNAEGPTYAAPAATSPVATEAVEANSATTVVSADKSQLEAVLTQAKAKNLDGQEASVKAEVAAAIAEAEALVANGSASQDQINQSVERLTHAVASVKEVTEAAETTVETTSEATTESSATPKVRSKRAVAEGTTRSIDETNLARAIVTKDNFESFFQEGGTASYDKSTGTIKLTDDVSSQVGSAYLRFKINSGEAFTFTGKVDIGNKYEGHKVDGRPGGDGVGFVFHTGKVDTIGQSGASVGMGTIKNAFGFKLDSWHNTSNPNANQNASADPKYGGRAWESNAFGSFYSSNNAGKVTTSSSAAKALNPAPSGQWVDFKIEYDKEKNFTVTYGSQTWTTNLKNANTSIMTFDAKRALTTGNPTFALSFLGSTGSGTNLQRVQIEKFEFTAPQIVHMKFVDAKGNEIEASSAIPGDENEVINLSTQDSKIAAVEAKGYKLKRIDASKAPSYNEGNNTVTLTPGGQLLTYVFAPAGPTVTPTLQVGGVMTEPGIKSTDNTISGIGKKGATIKIAAAGKTIVDNVTVAEDGSWSATLPSGVNSNITEQDQLVPRDTLTVTQTINGEESAETEVKVGLGESVVQPSESSSDKQSLVAETTTVTLKVPHDAGIAYFDYPKAGNARSEVAIKRDSIPGAWTSKDESKAVVTSYSSDGFFDTIVLEMKEQIQPGKAKVVSNIKEDKYTSPVGWKEINVEAKPADTTPPAAPTVNPVKAGATAITGTAEAGSTVEVTLPNGQKASAKAGDNGEFSITVPALSVDDQISVTATDAANNKSDATTVTVKENVRPVVTIPYDDKANQIIYVYSGEENNIELKITDNSGKISKAYLVFAQDNRTGLGTEDAGYLNGKTKSALYLKANRFGSETTATEANPAIIKLTANIPNGSYTDGTGMTRYLFAEDAAGNTSYEHVGANMDKGALGRIRFVWKPQTFKYTAVAPSTPITSNTVPEASAIEKAVKDANPTFSDKIGSVTLDGTNVKVTYKDGSTDTLSADSVFTIKPTAPTVTPVKNTSALTTPEKQAVEAAVRTKNPDATTVVVGNDGSTTLTYSNGSTAKLTPAQTVKAADSKGVQEPAAKTPVQNTSALTQPEKDAVKKAVEDANPTATKVEVGNDGSATVTFPDGTTATLTGDKTVKEADSKGVQEPAAKTPVQNTSALTQPEKDAVKKAVEDANPTATKVEVGNDGSATVTFPDGTTATLTGDKTVKEADSKGVQEPAAKTPVQNTSALTQPEKDAVKKAVEDANPTATKVEVGNDGSATVTFPDGTTATLTGDKTVKEADSKGVQEPAAKTPVQNTSALTQPEKDAVKKAVEDANPTATKVEVGNDGSATVTFPDGTTATLTGDKTVKEADSKGVQEPAAKTPVQNTSALTQPEKDAVKKAVEDANPTATKVEVGNDGSATVTFPDGTTATLTGDKTVKEADSKGVQEPAAKTPVQNTSALTQPEKDAVKKAVEDANPTATKVEVGNDGSATVTFPDGTTATLTGDKTVKEADSKGVQEPAAKTPVQNTSALTQPEKDAVKKAVEDANPTATKVEVGNDGSATVTFPDGTTATLTGDKTVKEADSKGVQEPAAKTPVQNTSALTQPEKDAVKKAVEDANPTATKVEVGNDGSATVTFPDGTTATLTGDKTVKEADSKGVQEPAAKTPVQNTSALTQPEKDAVKKAVEDANPTATKVEVGNDGSATVTFPDGTTATLTGDKTVKEADSKGVQEPAAKTPVQNTSALTQPEKDAVKKAVEDANPTATKVEVGNDGSATVTFPDGTTATLTGDKTVKEADSKGVQEPAAKTPVQNTSALTQPEKDAVKKAVEDANPTATKVEVGNDGSATVTFPDGTTATLTGDKTVKEADSKGVQEPAAKTPVQNTSALTQPEKDAVKKAVEDANPTATKVEVGNDGSATVTFPDGTTATLTGDKTVKEADSKGVQEPAAKTPVQNTSALTQPEKDAVKKAVEDANPTATKVEVGNDGSATVTFPDGTTATLTGDKTVKEADSKGVQEPAAKTPVQNTSALTQPEKDAVKKAVEDANPTATKVEVGNDGSATVTFPDGTTATLTGDKTVKEADDKTAPDAPVVNPVKAGDTAVTGTAEAGSTVEVTLPDGTKASATADQDGNFSVPVSGLEEGKTVSVTATDDAGNTSDATTATVAKADDKTAPAAPVVNPVKAGDTAVTGTAEAGSTVEVTLPNGTKATATADQDGNFSVPVSGLEEGKTVSVTATDDAGNTSDATTATVAKADDKTAPAAPVVNPVKAGDTAVTGTAEAGSTVEVTLPNGTKATATADQDGNFSVPVSGLEEGKTVSVTATDDAGNTSDATTATVAKADDKTAPAAPVVNPVKAGDTAVTGTAEAGSTVEVTLPNGDKVSAKADQDGNFSVPVSGLEEGKTVSVTATDDAGNTSDATTVTVAKADDKTAPAAPVVNDVKEGDKAVSGTAEPGTIVEITLPNSETVTVTTNEAGLFYLPVMGLKAGDKVTAVAKDASGNTSTPTEKTVGKGDGKDADNVKVPALTPVVDPNNLTDAEKAKVAEEVKKANPTATDVKVNNDGSVSVTYPDGSVATLTPVKTVKESEANGAKVPALTPVVDPNNLTDAEKAKVAEEVKKANPTATDVKVNNDGSVSVTYPDGSVATLTPVKTVKESEANGAKVPALTPVVDPNNLTDAEKAKVAEEVKKANPTATDVKVNNDGSVSVTYPDGSVATLTPAKTVKESEANGAKVPALTPVVDPNNLTDAEKAKVAEEVKKANPTATDVKVNNDGSVSVTYPDGSVATLTPVKTVKESEANGAKVPALTPVVDPNNLTDAEKAKVAEEVKKANPTATDVKVNNDGSVSVTYPDGSVATLIPAKTVKESEANGAKVPALTPVVDPNNLTDAEKAKVAEEVKKANPTATDVKVNNDGSVSVTFADGSVATIAANKVVKEATKESSAQAPSKKAGAKELPNTGTKQSNASLGLALLAAVTGGLLISKKRKEEE